MSLLRRSRSTPDTATVPSATGSTAGSTKGPAKGSAGGAGARPAEPVRVAGGAAGKGRATPKRRDAEGRRRGPAPAPPRTQREASKLARENRPDKEQRRAQRAEETRRRRAGMERGDDRYLPPRDRGPVRAHVRDLVDSRPHLLGLFMPLALIVVVSALVPNPAYQRNMSLFSLIMLVVMVAEGVYLGLTINRRVRAKYPDEQFSGLGLGWYAFTRATQPRKLRIPKPRVERGANP
ncbi:MAG TPA: DUF3043 domain-containing protein [Pseudonocardia sp.]